MKAYNIDISQFTNEDVYSDQNLMKIIDKFTGLWLADDSDKDAYLIASSATHALDDRYTSLSFGYYED